MNILLVQFLTKSLELLLLLSQLGSQVLDGLLQLGGIQGTVLQFLLKLGDEFLILLHLVGDEADVLLDFLFTVHTLASLSQGYTILGIANLAKSLLHLIESAHQVIDFTIFLSNDVIERI